MVDEDDPTSWPAGMTGRGLRGRRIARLMIVMAIVGPAMLGVMVASPPAMIGPMHSEDLNPLAAIVVGGGIIAYVIGLALMIRIYRADPEAHESFWRSRGH